MLSLGAGSSCDVCFERFGQDLKAPCSISCGHVFCTECISHIARLCPLCRTPFDPSSCIKLHLDVDSAPPLEPVAGCSPDDAKEAQRLHRAISRIVDSGIDEQGLRQLIHEGKAFLHGQPRQMHKDLRVAHRLIAYLCELKSNYRAQKQMNDGLQDQIQQLNTEKAELWNKLKESENDRKSEREIAIAVETSLREHNAAAARSYEVLIQVYNKLALSMSDLLKNEPVSSVPGSTAAQGSGISDSIAPTPMSSLMPMLDMSVLDGVAMREPGSSFLISPLPQFTKTLPAILDAFAPLPELAEDPEGEERSDSEEEDEELSTPDSGQHHRPIQGPPPLIHSSESISPRRIETVKGLEPSGLSRTAPYLEHRRGRSNSNPSHTSSRTHSPFDKSASVSPPASPQHLVSSPVQSQSSRYSQPNRDVYAPARQDSDVLRTRLHDLLRDSPTSASLPNLPSGHFPASFNNRDREMPIPAAGGSPPPPTRSGSSNSGSSKTPIPTQSASNDSVSHLLASGSHQQMAAKPMPVPSPNPLVGQRYSSASAEAKKLEEERRKKYMEEKQQRAMERQQYEERYRDERYKEDRYRDERHREERPKEERHREERHRDERYRDERYREERRRDERHGVEYERPPADADREYRPKIASTASAAAASSQSSRRDQPSSQNYVYANPMSASSSMKRGSNTSNAHAKPTAVPSTPVQEQVSGTQSRYPPSSSGNKPRSVPISPNAPGIYA